MAEKIVLAEFLIEGIDDIVEETSILIKNQNILRNSNKQLDKSNKEQAAQYFKNQVQIKDYSKQISINEQLVTASTIANRKLSIELEREVTSIAKARASNKELLKIRNSLNLTTAKGRNELNLINTKLDENNAFIKENVSQYEKQKINIGNYEGALRSTFPVLGNVVGVLRTMKTALTDVRTATLASGAANGFLSKSLRVLKIALISTGIGAIVVALGSLVAFLTSTQRGIDEVTKVTKPLQVIFQRVLGVIQELGETLFDTLSNPKQLIKDLGDSIKQNLSNRFEALIKIVNRIKTFNFEGIGEDFVQAGTGVVDFGDKLKQAGQDASDFFSEAIEKGQELRQLNIDIEQGEAELVLTRAQLLDQIKEQELIAKDTTLSGIERNKASEEALRISKELAKEEKDILLLKIQEEELQQSLNDSGREDLEKLNQLKAQLIAKDQEDRARELKFISARSAFVKEQQAAAKKAVDAAIKQQKVQLDLFIALQGIQAKTLQEEIEISEQVSKRKLEILKEELAAKKITQDEFNLKSLELEQELLRQRAQLAVDLGDRELQNFISANQSKLEANKFFTDELFNQEVDRLNRVAEKEKEFAALRLQEGVINQTEYNDAVNEVNETNRLAQEQLTLQREEAEKVKKAVDLENQSVIDQENFLSRFEIQSERLEKQRLKELEVAEKTGADVGIINDKFALRQQRLDIAVQENKIAAASAAFGQLAGLLGEQTAIGKLFAIAQATIDTYAAANLALKTLPPPFGAISAGVSIATGLGNVAKIASTRTTFEDGGSTGMLKGKSHSQGGIPIEVEGGEYIFSKKTVQRLGTPMLDAMNFGQATPSINTSGFFRDGGLTTRNITSGSQEIRRTQELIASSINDIRVINEASDTVSVAQDEALIVENASF